MDQIQEEIGLTNDEVAIIIYTSVDLDWFTNLVVCAGEFTKWFNINFEGESPEEIEFKNRNQNMFVVVSEYATIVNNEFSQVIKNDQDKEIITQQRWWMRLRYKKFANQLAIKFKETP